MRLFLSYQTQDRDAAQRLRTALLRRRPGLEIFIDREGLIAGDIWQQALAERLAEADAVLLLLGRKLGPWQEREFQEAQRLQLLAGRERRPRIIPVALIPDAQLPPFSALYQHVAAAVPDAEDVLDRILAGLERTDAADPTPDWKRINPYKGLAALDVADAAYFFGRERETATILDRIRARPGKVLALVGNSGVGKSSLIQAGVVDALRTQRWPGTEGHNPADWLGGLADSHRWPTVVFRPGERPILALAFALLRLVFEPNAKLEAEAREWAALLLSGTPVERLVAQVTDHLNRAGQPVPKRFLIYIDQGEELYARSVNDQRSRFSALIAEAAARPELHVLISLRSDYYGSLQNDAALFNASERLDLPPMSADSLARAITEPARRLGVRFEPLAAPKRLSEIAAPQSGALPLLSDLMADLWREMLQRGDGVLSWRERTDLVDVGRPLSARADRYLADHPADRNIVRDLFTLRLAHVPPQGEPVRRRARRNECTGEQWRIVNALSDQEWRLLTVSEDPATHEPTVEVAHEQLLRSWATLRDWLKEDSAFLQWRATFEQGRIDWETAGKPANKLLLRDERLTRARYWRAERRNSLSGEEVAYIAASENLQRTEDEQRLKEREEAARNLARRTRIGAFIALTLLVVAGSFAFIAFREQGDARSQRALAEAARSQAETALDDARTQRVRAEDAHRTADEQKKKADDALAAASAAEIVSRDLKSQADKAQADAEQARSMALAENRRALANQSRFMAQAAQFQLERGDFGTALALALEALPRNAMDEDRPYVPEAERVLQTIIRHPVQERCAMRRPETHVSAISLATGNARAMTTSLGMFGAAEVALWDLTGCRFLALLRPGIGTLSHSLFSPDGRWIAIASHERAGILLDAASGQDVIALEEPGKRIDSIAFSIDSKFVAAVFEWGVVKIWDTTRLAPITTIKVDPEAIDARFSSDGKFLATLSKKGLLQIWAVADGTEQGSVSAVGVDKVAFSRDDRYVVGLSSDRKISIWDRSLAAIAMEDRFDDRLRVDLPNLSPDGERVLTIGNGGDVIVRSSAHGTEFGRLHGHEEAVRMAEYSADGRLIVTRSDDGTARIWDAETYRTIGILGGGQHAIASVAIATDSSSVVAADEGGTISSWRLRSTEEPKALSPPSTTTGWAGFSPDGSSVITVTTDPAKKEALRIWRTAEARELRILEANALSIGSVSYAPDGKRILATVDGVARLWDAKTGEVLAEYGLKEDGGIGHVEFSSSGDLILVMGNETLQVLDGQLKELKNGWKARPREQFTIARFSPDGSMVLAISDESADSSLDLFLVGAQSQAAPLRHSIISVSGAAFSPDGRKVVAALSDSFVVLEWDTASGNQRRTFGDGDRRLSEPVSFSPDGKLLISASPDRTTHLWDFASGRPVVLQGHKEAVRMTTISNDGSQVATASDDRAVRLWDPRDGRETAILSHPDRVFAVEFSKDRAHILSRTTDIAYLWRNFRTTQELIDYACSIMTRPLTPKQRREFFLEEKLERWPCNWPPDAATKPAYAPLYTPP